MPFVTVAKEKDHTKVEEVYHPEIKWVIEPKDHEGKYAGEKKDVLTVVIEQAPRKRTINFRHAFYAGDKYTTYYLAMPWTYYVARVNQKGVILLSGMFFSNEELKSFDQEGLCAAPLPNNDYGIDKGLGVCLWKAGASFGKEPKAAVVKAHEYIWTSDFNPGVRYYDSGRPESIHASSWGASLAKWQELTEKDEKIVWVPVKSKVLHRVCKTLEDAFEWLCKESDHLYQ